MSTVDLTDEQELVAEGVEARLRSGHVGITIGGLAGTGKTTLAAQLPERLGLSSGDVAYCAFTGKAADRLCQTLGRPDAQTIHSLIYHPAEVHCERCPAITHADRDDPREKYCHGLGLCGCRRIFTLRQALDPEPRLIIVDEASMVNGTLFRDLNSFGVPVIWIGDHGQLPPVGGDFNPMGDPDFRLETIHRQVADSPILQLAMAARQGRRIPYGDYGDGVRCLPSGGSLTWLDNGWPSDLMLLCGYNRTRVATNHRVRVRLGFAGAPAPGDRVVCLRNNREAGVFNGMLGTVEDCILGRPGVAELGVLLDSGRSYRGRVLLDQFGTPKTLPVVGVDLWDFGYCLTVHKAQGSEADRVVLREEWLGFFAGSDPAARSRYHARWLYTGITRARSELTLVRPW